MLHTIIKENSYQDSVNLMLLTNRLSTMEGVNKISVMMGTPANLDIFKNTGLYTIDLEEAKPNDMCIVADADSEKTVGRVLAELDSFLKYQAVSSSSKEFETVRTWDRAMKTLPSANVAIISVPGQYAAEEAEKALNNGLHAFLFSDNVPIEDELRLKKLANEKGLLVMGPDCGTGIASGIPVAFANIVTEGNIGIVGASGTGIQEVTTIIDRLGGGVSHAIGTGGRDLSNSIGAITMMDSIRALENHRGTKVIAIISKQPAKEVRNQVVRLLRSVSKPVVALFMGEKPAEQEGHVIYAGTLEETAILSVQLANGNKLTGLISENSTSLPAVELKAKQTAIKGLFSGGTLAAEAAKFISEALGLQKGLVHEEGYLLKVNGHEVIDLGDDKYTQGKPHPMIDPETRIQFIQEAAKDECTAIILLDVVLGYGSHDDMAGALFPAIVAAQDEATANGRNLYFVATLCGTEKDPQDYQEQKTKLESAGVIVRESNVHAIKTTLKLLNIEVPVTKREFHPVGTLEKKEALLVSEQISKLVNEKPAIVNVGLKKFTQAVTNHGGQVVQFDWRPAAGGNERMRKILALLK
ncbi:acyl-CoA synthetase FdrA [Peribacillus simplex]|uniref:acyl-CoA synthetase FdrA n=1 Tax=Peribacillus simplex TaxID=1478 RepID=UPI0024C1C87A|nr:acyl-CoA synthetase FdrA [Peribacillus simplex]WHY99515.1 acyl-CoA synthetase FdrA [Peribacillus simplex]